MKSRSEGKFHQKSTRGPWFWHWIKNVYLLNYQLFKMYNFAFIPPKIRSHQRSIKWTLSLWSLSQIWYKNIVRAMFLINQTQGGAFLPNPQVHWLPIISGWAFQIQYLIVFQVEGIYIVYRSQKEITIFSLS